jgi:3D (Asp-Asp-Asp) domain-containing protein
LLARRGAATKATVLTTTETNAAMIRAFLTAAAVVLLAFAPAAALAQDLAPAKDPIGELIAGAVATLKRVTDLHLKATLYHAGARGVGGRDSLGCAVVPMRTLAVDPRIIPKHAVVFIQETVGLILPDGRVHDGLWYASDTGGAIKGSKVDLYTGSDSGSMKQFYDKKVHTGGLNAAVIGVFKGCPPT